MWVSAGVRSVAAQHHGTELVCPAPASFALGQYLALFKISLWNSSVEVGNETSVWELAGCS